MAVTNETSTKNQVTDYKCGLINGGSVLLREGTTTIATIVLPNPAFGGASNGIATANAITPVNASASTSGSGVDNYQVRDDANAVKWSGTVGESGSGADMIIQNVNVNENQQIAITSWTHEALSD
jgi:hypothetical protein